MLITAKRVAVIPKVIYCYLRRSNGSITTDDSLNKKRCLSKIEIYRRYKKFGKELNCRKDKRALSYCQYNMAAFIWNCIDLCFIRKEGEQIGLNDLISSFKHDVLNNLFYDRKFLHLVRQILFLVNPTFLKKIHKNL